MALATVESVQDRIYEILQTITGVNAVRTFPSNFDSVRWPVAFSLPRGRRVSVRGVNYNDRAYEIVLVLGDWFAGVPTESMQLLAEQLIDDVIDAFETRPRLQLANVPLSGVTDTLFNEDTGIQPERQQANLAAVYFTLTVTTPAVRQAECY